MVCLLHRARVKNSPGPSVACSNTNPCACASSAQASSKPANTPGPASPSASWTTIKNCSTSAAPHQYAPYPAHYKIVFWLRRDKVRCGADAGALCLSCLIRHMIQWQGKTIVTDIGQNEENGNPTRSIEQHCSSDHPHPI